MNGGVLSILAYMGLCPKGVLFQASGIQKVRDFTRQVEVYERGGKSVMCCSYLKGPYIKIF